VGERAELDRTQTVENALSSIETQSSPTRDAETNLNAETAEIAEVLPLDVLGDLGDLCV
jgi:hypothetical protein